MGKYTYSNYFKKHDKDDNVKEIYVVGGNLPNSNSELEVFLASWGVNNLAELNSRIAEWLKRPNITLKQWMDKQNELNIWTITFAGKTPADVKAELNTTKGKVLTSAEEEVIREYNNVKTERDNRPNITLTVWNDHKDRPTQL